MRPSSGPATALRAGRRSGSSGRVVLDRRVLAWGGDRLLLGGSPWHVVRLAAPAADLIGRLRAAGPAGLVPGPADRAAAAVLVEHGFAHPVVGTGPAAGRPVDRIAVVVPAYGRPEQLAACLGSVGERGLDVVAVDDASPDEAAVARAIHSSGVRRVRHAVNGGPAAARNTGLAATSAPVVAFLDSDCTAGPDWLDALLPLFDDPRVGAVAPRVRPRHPDRATGRPGLLARHEAARSALDMGPHPALVRPGAALGFVPSAALLVRRDALDSLADGAFDPALRLGEDVDLVWRLADAGWHVRYEPAATVGHACRVRPGEWLRRRFDYGTSAADLDARHPGRLTPARPSAWNLVALALLVAGRPVAAAAVSATAAGLLRRRLAPVGGGPGLATLIVGKGLLADALALGHALRREWWPLGWAALSWVPTRAGGGGRLARAATAAMLAPLVLEWLRSRWGADPVRVDPVRYGLLRLVEDAAYGSGVLVSAVRGRRPRALLPAVRLPSRLRRP